MSKIAMVALTANEKKDTYIYLLRAFEGFFGHRPKSIYTDMDVSFAAAIAEEWPDVLHM